MWLSLLKEEDKAGECSTDNEGAIDQRDLGD